MLGLPSADSTLTLGVYMEKTELRQSSIEQLVRRIIDSFPELKDILRKVDPEKVYVYTSRKHLHTKVTPDLTSQNPIHIL